MVQESPARASCSVTSDRLEGVEVVEVSPDLGVEERVGLRKVQVVGEKGVVTRPPVASPVRDDLVSGGGWDMAGLVFSGIQVLLLHFRPFP